jgi:hypothetical protein
MRHHLRPLLNSSQSCVCILWRLVCSTAGIVIYAGVPTLLSLQPCVHVGTRAQAATVLLDTLHLASKCTLVCLMAALCLGRL